MVDVEADGPIPGDFSLLEIGAVLVDKTLDKTFYGKLKPISDKFVPEALKVFHATREQTLLYDDPVVIMNRFFNWIIDHSHGRKCIFISDNNGFDWMFVAWYFHHFLGKNPFGYSSTNLGSLYKGLVKTTNENFKHLRGTELDHNPVNDALANARAFLFMISNLGLKVNLD